MPRAAVLLLLLVTAACGGRSPAPVAPASALDALELDDVRVDVLQAGMARGDFTARQLTERYLARIAELDDDGPRLNAVIEVNPEALRDADRLDAERASGEVRGPLHGVPVLIKDNIDVVGMANSAGSLALADHRPPADAHLVGRLRAAGLIVLGKANLSEWANFRSTRSSSGWSARGGQTRNPFVLDRSPCGSSAGSGVAVAAGLAPLAVGTETDGSIICPAAVNGVVGVKPTVGLVSRHGIIPISPSQDTAGPMAQSVADAARLLTAMAGADARDDATAVGAGHVAPDYAAFLDPGALAGARIGLVRQSMGYHNGVDAVMEAAVAALRAAGAVVVDPVEIPTWGRFSAPEFEVLLSEFGPALADYLRTSGAPHRDLQALMAFNEAEAERQMPWFGQELFAQAAAKPGLDDPAYQRARDLARRLAGPEGIDAALAAHRLDALLTTAVSPAWAIDLVNGDHFLGAGYSAAAVAGYPSITVPAGDVHGLPVGVVFLGPAWSEGRLIALAHAFEQAHSRRLRPSFRPTVEH
jgi:amidase